MGFIMYFLQIDMAYFDHILPNSLTYLPPLPFNPFCFSSGLHSTLRSLTTSLYYEGKHMTTACLRQALTEDDDL